ncbi:MAG TPA: nuclear transport factor 2 family protein [Burkholderiaceae bacterium]|nr:nuclear transport factor 2 family protein [Burkholderiaceae bacterium]
MSEALIRRFFDAFAALDGAAMAACYHPQASFSDPVFPDLRGGEPGAMWRMLTAAAARSGDFRLDYRIARSDERKAQVLWEAHYPYRPGRKVHNRVRSTLTVWDGAIVRHVDEFAFWSWSRQALGASGWLLGWAPAYRRAVQRAARGQLDRFIAREGASPS